MKIFLRLAGGVITIGALVVAGFCFQRYQIIMRDNKQKDVQVQVYLRTREIAQFNKLLIDRILLNEKTVTFDERLALENAVRKLNDTEILAQWNRFVESKDEVNAQVEMKKILGILATKIER